MPVSPHELAADVQALMSSPAADKGLTLATRVDPAVPLRVLLDGTRVRQVLFNLLSNAIKFTERGSVSLDIHASAGRLCMAVIDSGIGMDEATKSRLFQRFTQGDDSTSRRHGGTGLGLEISRSLARLMGGNDRGAERARPGQPLRAALAVAHRAAAGRAD